ncbi:MAG TPA: hypothetical protein DHW42_08790 [Candidatus Marinimicrobia bacterium]|nr:hypothetical protein [Candidatus Neomarinimicrobiota bacterium]
MKFRKKSNRTLRIRIQKMLQRSRPQNNGDVSLIGDYIKNWRAVVITALFLLYWVDLSGQNTEHLSMWIVRDQMTNRESIDKFIEFADRNGFTDLFVQVRGRGDAFYKSSIVCLASAVQDQNFDPLKYTLEKAHPKNIKVHAWLNMYLLWTSGECPSDNNHLVNQHSEWFAVDADDAKDVERKINDFKKNNTTEIYLSPLVPDVNKYLVGIVKELVELYHVDGIHLDYIRYPNRSYDYNEVGRKRFIEIYGVDPILLSASNGSYFSRVAVETIENMIEKWSNFRRDAITELVVGIRSVIITTRKPILLSAAVKPDPFNARHLFYQDWENWLKKDYLDFAVPMNYTKNAEQFEQALSKIDPLISKEKIWMGIGAFNQDRYDALTKIMISFDSGYSNLALFSYKTFINQPDYLPPLLKAFHVNNQ